MIRAVLFDLGGTLDGDGLQWLDRFAGLYADAGVLLPGRQVKEAFDEAERRAATDDEMAVAHLDGMIERHVGWQLEHLAAGASLQPKLADRLVAGFVGSIRSAAVSNVRLLAELFGRGLRLGVVSNGCGNVDVLCGDLGYAPYLSAIVDSRRVGLFKPDPAIFIHAAAKLGVPASGVMMVGDSFDRDIRPAKNLGMTTAWLEGARPRDCVDPSLVDIRLRRLAELSTVFEARTVA